MELTHKTAIITGVSKGLGRAIAQQLIKKDVLVYGIARDEKSLDKMATELGSNFIPVVLDLQHEKLIFEWIDSTFNAECIPDILINNAGLGYFADVDQISLDMWYQMMSINISATHHFCSRIGHLMKQSETSSHIINIGSIVGKVSGSQKSAYSATKFAINGYSEALFKELRGYNIKVSCVNPGSINTDFFKSSGLEANDKMLSPNEVAEIVLFLLQTPDNVLIDELSVRPLRP